MGLATRLGPWLLGTVKNTIATVSQSNAQLGLITNLGASTCIQNRAIVFGETTAQTNAFVLPAGSILLNAAVIVTTAFNAGSPTITLFARGTQITSAVAVTSLATGQISVPLGVNSAAAGALCANVGTTDALIAFTLVNGGSSAGAMTLWLEYAVRNPDGTYVPAYNQA